jgi:hypothetical protein
MRSCIYHTLTAGSCVLCFIKYRNIGELPIPGAERSKARVYGLSLAGIAGSNTAEGMDVCPLGVLCVVR